MGGTIPGCILPGAFEFYFARRGVPNELSVELMRQIQVIDMAYQEYEAEKMSKSQKEHDKTQTFGKTKRTMGKKRNG